MKTALHTCITGKGGVYLAQFLFGEDDVVHGIKRRASSFNGDRADPLCQDPHPEDRRFIMHYGDLTDATNLVRIIQDVQPGRNLQPGCSVPCPGIYISSL